jgi:hypothetical protein
MAVEGSQWEEIFDERQMGFLLAEYRGLVRSMVHFERVGDKKLFSLFAESLSKTNSRWKKRICDSRFVGSSSLGRTLISLSTG